MTAWYIAEFLCVRQMKSSKGGSFAYKLLVLLAVASCSISLAVRWFILHCTSRQCFLSLLHVFLVAFVPRHIMNDIMNAAIVQPPKCYLQFDQLPARMTSIMKGLAFQHYNPESNIRTTFPGRRDILPLNVTMLLIGTTGDVLPFVPVASELVSRGHRVRVATHRKFRDLFPPASGVDFFQFEFDPALFMEYLEKQTLFITCDLQVSLRFLFHYTRMFVSFFPAVSSPDARGRPFRSDLIIVTPHAAGYEVVAEWLQVPVHAMVMHPSAPTKKTPHAFSRELISPTWTEHHVLMTHQALEMIPWSFQYPWVSLLRWWYGLPQVPYLNRPKGLIPYSMLYSPRLAPHYSDWGDHVEIVGTCHSPAQNVSLPQSLLKWLSAGPTPICVGFGSTHFEDSQGLTRMVVEALNRTGYRGILQRGWGGLGHVPEKLPDSVYLLEGFVPHDALFPLCQAAVHHGGIGTITAALRAKLSQVAVPFIIDQTYWAERVDVVGVGKSIPFKDLTVDSLSAGIEFALSADVRDKAEMIGQQMLQEDGAKGAVDSVFSHLPSDYEPGKPCTPWMHAPKYGREDDTAGGESTGDRRWHC